MLFFYTRHFRTSIRKISIFLFNSLYFIFLQQWELIVLNKLKWNISSVTPLDFLEHLLVRLPINKQHTDVSKIKKHAQAFISLAARGKFEKSPITKYIYEMLPLQCCIGMASISKWNENYQWKWSHQSVFQCANAYNIQKSWQSTISKIDAISLYQMYINQCEIRNVSLFVVYLYLYWYSYFCCKFLHCI